MFYQYLTLINYRVPQVPSICCGDCHASILGYPLQTLPCLKLYVLYTTTHSCFGGSSFLTNLKHASIVLICRLFFFGNSPGWTYVWWFLWQTCLTFLDSKNWGKGWASSQMQMNMSTPKRCSYQYVYCIDQTAVYSDRTFFISHSGTDKTIHFS